MYLAGLPRRRLEAADLEFLPKPPRNATRRAIRPDAERVLPATRQRHRCGIQQPRRRLGRRKGEIVANDATRIVLEWFERTWPLREVFVGTTPPNNKTLILLGDVYLQDPGSGLGSGEAGRAGSRRAVVGLLRAAEGLRGRHVSRRHRYLDLEVALNKAAAKSRRCTCRPSSRLRNRPRRPQGSHVLRFENRPGPSPTTRRRPRTRSRRSRRTRASPS